MLLLYDFFLFWSQSIVFMTRDVTYINGANVLNLSKKNAETLPSILFFLRCTGCPCDYLLIFLQIVLLGFCFLCYLLFYILFYIFAILIEKIFNRLYLPGECTIMTR